MTGVKTFMLLAGLVALFGLIGLFIGGPGGMMIALALALGLNIWTYWNSDKMVLNAYRAQEVSPEAADPRLRAYVEMVHELAKRAELPMPRTYLIDEDQPNAFATGRNPQNAAVAVTRGLLERLEPRALRGVLAHELAHIKHYDTLNMTITASFAGAISSLANMAMFFGPSRNEEGEEGPNFIVMILMTLLAPIAAMLVQMAISRTREYEADRLGAEISGDPEALAQALEKIESSSQHIPNYQAQNEPATAHMFIINPLSGRMTDNLFSTHPSTANRVQALMQLAAKMGAQKSFTSVPVTSM